MHVGHPRATLNIMNVYNPNNRTDRATFWERIRLQVAGEEWRIGGDFNMIESLHDSSNNHPIFSKEMNINSGRSYVSTLT